MAARRPLPFDPIARASELWAQRIGPADAMGAVTSIMRVQQILQAAGWEVVFVTAPLLADPSRMVRTVRAALARR